MQLKVCDFILNIVYLIFCIKLLLYSENLEKVLGNINKALTECSEIGINQLKCSDYFHFISDASGWR